MKRQFWAAVIAATTFAGVANAQLSWTAGSSSAGYEQAIAYGGGVFVAVGPAPQFAVSSDGLNWTPTATNPSIWWTGVTYGNGTFVAVGTNGFATSSDGTNWSFTTPPNNTEWNGVAYGNGIFVTVAFDGISHSVATSTDGVAWTVQTAAAANQWVSITYGSGLFVAVAQSGSGNRVMTSPDGVTWTSRTSAANLNWASVTYGNGLFVAVAQDGVTNSVMTSPDGITWTLRTAAASAQWYSVAYGAGLFAAVAQDGITNSVMTSSDGVTWTIGPAATADQWQCIAFGNGIFVAGSTSGDTMAAAPPTSATTYTFTGPSGGTLNSGSNNFAVTPNGQYTGTITVTPSGGGLSTATVLTFNASSAAQMFTITPTAVGPVTLTPSNNGSLTDASVLMYSTPPGAPTLTSVTAGSHQISVAFTAPGSTGGSAIIGFTATCGSSAVSGSASPIIVTSLTNGAAYTCTVTASNTNGTSAASSASSSVTPTAPATGYSLTGPSGGSLNTASTNFTVTPNGLYTGTITITPSGGTLSTPVVLTFSNSATPQTFTITPASVGPVTLTPSNNGSLTDPSALTYGTPPAAPTVTSATPGNGQISVAFTANGTGGSTITGYSATCGGNTITGAASPILVTSLTNGAAYTCTVQATNTNGASAASSASSSVTPVAPATGYTLTGPSGGLLNAASTNFTVTPNGPYTGTNTITPSGGGLSTAIVLTFSNSSTPQTFTITPTSVGPVTLTPTNNGSLTNASALTYSTPPAAPTVTSATPGNGQISVAFTANGTGGSMITSYSATCGSSTITSAVSPILVTSLTNGAAYTCTVQATNNNGISIASSASNSATPVAPANSYSFSGPTGGALNTASSNFTVTPNAGYTGTVTITPSGGGLATPVVLTFNNSPAAQTFTITPNAVGPVSLTPSNSGSLTNPPALAYGTPPAAPTVTSATPGNGQISVAFTANGTGGATITSYSATCGLSTITGVASPITVTGLTNGTAYTCAVKATNNNGIGVASSASNSAIPVAPANSYTFSGPTGGALNIASSNFTITPNATYTGTITITPSGGGLATPVTLTFNNSSAPQTFTVTPTAVGPVTLTPSNNSSLTNASALTYGTPPAAPAVISVTPGNAQISVAFAANGTGGSPITSYTATCGGSSISGAASPILVMGLTNGTAYTCTVKATNGNGMSAVSIASNTVTPVAPANSYSFSGPTGGALNAASANFTVTPNALYSGTVTVAVFGGGLFSSKVLTFSNSSAPQTFTITPIAVGPLSLTPSNTGSLANPPALTYATPPAAPFITSVSPGNGQISIAFFPNGSGGSPVTSYAATCSGGGATGTASSGASPITVTGLSNGQPYTCVVTATNAAGTSAPSGTSVVVSPLSPATSFTMNGPSGGALNAASAAFTVTPDAAFTGTITIMPSGGGLSAPQLLSFSNSSSPQTFTIAPVAVGPVVLTATNSGRLVNPAALSYATPPAPPTIGVVTTGNGVATVAFTASVQTGGSPITGYKSVCNPGNIIGTGFSSPLTLNGLTNGTAFTCTVAATNAAGTGAASAPTSAFVLGLPGVPQGLSAVAGTNQAVVSFFPPVPVAGAPLTGYKVIASPGGVSATGANSPIVIGGLTNGIAYTFSVSAISAAGAGPAAVSNVVVPAGPPGAPLAVAAAAGNGQATVSFSAPSDNGSPIVSYTVISNPGGNSARASASPIVVSGLSNGTSYTFTVMASNGIATGPASSSSNSVTPLSRSGSPLVFSNVSTLPAGIAGADYPRQVLVTTGGAPPYTLAISSGLLPPGLTLVGSQLSGIPTSTGNFSFVITVADSVGNASSAPASILIGPAGKVDLILSQGVVSFAIASGSQTAPAPVPVTVRSSDVLQRLGFTAAQSPTTPWLAVSGNGTTPGEISIGLSPAALSLAPGTYQSAVTVSCVPASPCEGTTKTLMVAVNVASVLPAITLTDNLLKFESIGSSAGSSSQITGLQNSGGGSLVLNSASPADSWLSVSKVPNAINAGSSVPLTISADSTGLAAGLYNSSILFSSSAGPATLPVQLLVSAKPLIQLLPTGSQFNVGWESSPGNPQGSFLVATGSDAAIQWQASVLSGASWLKVQTPKGSASAAAPGTVIFSVDSAALAGNPAQAYYGVVRLSSDDSANSPIDYEVVLNILDPQMPVQPEPNPAGLLFLPFAAASQTVSVHASSDGAVPYQVSTSTQDGGSWLQVTPTMGSASSIAPGQSIVSVSPAGLAPGVYRGSVNYAFSGQAVRTVSIMFLVGDSSSCNPNQLVAAQVGITDNFQQPLGWPAEIAAAVTDGCGAPVSNAQVLASFSNGDVSLPLSAVAASAGRYSATWTPHSVSSQVGITVTATSGNSLAGPALAASTLTSGQVTANAPPVLAPNGVIPALSHIIGGPLTTGSPVEIYGYNLAGATLTAAGPSLPIQLGGTTVTIGGIPAPLMYVSPNQINVLVPAGLTIGTQYQVQVSVNGALSAAETIELFPASVCSLGVGRTPPINIFQELKCGIARSH